MLEPIDFTSWIAGWTSLAAVILLGWTIISRAVRTERAKKAIPLRILVTGTRGKSGTVRLLHNMFMEAGKPTFGKVTGTTAVELHTDGTETPTVRFGAAGVSEMPEAVIRAAKEGADVGVFECMAITPRLISLVAKSHVTPHVVIIPSIRLDHLEEEGLTISEIATNIVKSLNGCEYLVAGVDQPEVVKAFETHCVEEGITFIQARPTPATPIVPGHHPTNVAVALAVCEIAGIDRHDATRHLEATSLEPRALTMMSVVSDEGTVNVIDLGAANDPQSAWEALESCCLEGRAVVPLMVNRWERPLRSVVFACSILGRFPLVVATGPLTLWMRKLHGTPLAGNRNNHQPSTVIHLTRKHASNPKELLRDLLSRWNGPAPDTVYVLILENTHETRVDLFRKSLENIGTVVPLGAKEETS
jgi:poly-gamma-glutamate synthase PgsB/CapB